MRILGISCYYHDSAACLVVDGQIVAAAQEERFTRKKHDAAFPHNAVRYVLAEGGIAPGETLDAVAFYDKPLKKFHRLLETWLSTAPKGFAQYAQGLPIWLREKLWIEADVEGEIEKLGWKPSKILFPEHHLSHAASAFFPSPYEEAAILTLDGVGEWATSTIGHGKGNRVHLLEEQDFPHSLGLLYSAITLFCGFKVNSGEYKLMGLAPYGQPTYRKHLEKLIDLRDDGSFRLDLSYFGYLDGLSMVAPKMSELLDGPPRNAETHIQKREMDIARSIQDLTEDIVLRMARHAREKTGAKYLCMAGGVALNCVANGKLLRSKIFDDLWIQPAAGDAGGAVGAALTAWHHAHDGQRTVDGVHDGMQGGYLGPEFPDDEIEAWLTERGYPFTKLSDSEWAPELARRLASERVVGMCSGRMEFGPRALGNRSILGDPRSPKMQSVMNQKIKFRESFRPFAPSVKAEKVSEWFEMESASPYMLLCADVVQNRRMPLQGDEEGLDLMQWVNRPRSDVPAITHVDYSARIQTVHKDTNPRYWSLLDAFEALTGCPVLINTSFNVRGEPIICTPEDAYRCFMRTHMDDLVLGSYLVERTAQPAWNETEKWQETFTLD